MPNHRVPLALAQASGRTIVNPARFADRADPEVVPLLPAGDYLDPLERECFEYFRTTLWWLGESDRAIVNVLARCYARFQLNTLLGSEYGAYMRALHEVGATPAGRSKVPKQNTHRPKNRFA